MLLGDDSKLFRLLSFVPSRGAVGNQPGLAWPGWR